MAPILERCISGAAVSVRLVVLSEDLFIGQTLGVTFR